MKNVGDPNKNSYKGRAHLQGSELTSALFKPPEDFSPHHLKGSGKEKQVQGPDLRTDEDWADLQGKERWNLLLYSRTNHPIEFEGVKVKLSVEQKTILQNGNTREYMSTKKSLQAVVRWLIDKYTEDA